MTAGDYIKHLQLVPHPEGGYFRETYRSEDVLMETCLANRFSGNRSVSTAIYYLLQQNDFSAFHRIRSDECWHFYAGGPLIIHSIDPYGNYQATRLGSRAPDELFQYVVPHRTWFAAEPASDTPFALAGCTVAPGFDFADFEMADKQRLIRRFPNHGEVINRLCR